MPRAPRALRALLAPLVACSVAVAFAPHARAMMFEEEPEEGNPSSTSASISSGSFAGLVGLAKVQRDLKSFDSSVRAAAVARAAEMGGDEAWRIVEAAASDSFGDDLDGALRVRLAAARALAFDPRRASATAALRLLLAAPTPILKMGASPGSFNGPMPPWGGPMPVMPMPPLRVVKHADGELVRFVRETAAIALAQQGDFDPLVARARVHDDLEASRAALAALVAFPPPSLASITSRSDGMVSRETVEVLTALGDLRAADALLRVARGKDDVAAALAFVALAKLGDGRVAAIARAVPSDADARLRIAAAEALGELGEPSAEAAILALSANKKTEAEGLRLALAYPSAGLIATLSPPARLADARALAALGRIGSAAIPALLAIARDDAGAAGAADGAAYALATMPGSSAEDALASIVDGAPSTAVGAARIRRAVRAAAVRQARIGSSPSSLRDQGARLQGSKDDADRFVSALLSSVRDLSRAKELLSDGDVVRRRAAAVALGAHRIDDGAEIARAHLALAGSSEDASVVRALAAVAARAVDGTAAHDVPITTSTLAVWLAQDGDASPLAAYLLAARGGEAVQPHVARALASDDLSVRACALLGLALSPEPSATGELTARLPMLVLPSLRRAAVRALVARGDVAGRRALTAARRLDPDAEIRALASTAVLLPSARPTTPLARGAEVLQAKVVRAAGAQVSAMLVSVDGFAVPAVADPEGFVVVFRIAAGAGRLDVRPLSSSLAPTTMSTKGP